MSYNAEVEAIQKALNAVNIPVKVDGIFGDQTEEAILLFQRSYTPSNKVHNDYEIGEDDGVVAQKTVLALDEALVDGWRYKDYITPIYPVRYAYANFFEEALEKPSRPPELSTLLNKIKVSETKGYMARLLRPGWVYIKEEVGGSNLQIFQYQHEELASGEVTEKYQKHSFTNKMNAQGGLTRETARSYPFAFVNKKVTEVSMLYSEMPLHADVIDAINGDDKKRSAFMQRINLQSDDPNTLEATEENLRALVDDYREQKDRILAFRPEDLSMSHRDENGDNQETKLENLGLDLVTSQNSYKMSANKIAQALIQDSAYGEVAQIVALHDPIAIQRDISNILSSLVLWEKNYKATNIYPYSIGAIIQSLNDSNDKEMKKIVKDTINLKEHSEYWGALENNHELFSKRKKQFAQLSIAFMRDEDLIGQVGSLDTYLEHMFATPKDSNDANEEAQKLSTLAIQIFDGLLSSEEGTKELESFIYNDENNLYVNLLEGIGKVLTLSIAIEWNNETQYSINSLLTSMGPWWAKKASEARHNLSRIKLGANAATVNEIDKYLVNKLMPSLFNVLNLEIMNDKYVFLTDSELTDLLDSWDKHNLKYGAESKLPKNVRQAIKKENRGQKLFDWGQRRLEASNSRIDALNDKRWKVQEIAITSGGGYTPEVSKVPGTGQGIGIMLDDVFTGASIVLNIMALSDFNQQNNDYNNNSPFERGKYTHGLISVSSTLLSLTSDLMNTKNLVKYLGKFKYAALLGEASTALAKRIAPNLVHIAVMIGIKISEQALSKLIAAANLFAAIDSLYSSFTSAELGNKWESRGHLMVGVASIAFFVGALGAAGVGGAASVAALTTFLAVLAVLAVALLVIGIVTLAFSAKSDLEILLMNCFWGSGEKYVFWDNLFKDGERPSYADRIDRIKDSDFANIIASNFQIELQEFKNQLYMPKLEIETTGAGWITTEGELRTYRYTFTLPGFTLGASDLQCQLYTKSAKNQTYQSMKDTGQLNYTNTWEPNDALTTQLKQAVENAEISIIKDKPASITVSITTNTELQLHWYYQPKDDTVAPCRYITKNGLAKDPIIGMVDKEFV